MNQFCRIALVFVQEWVKPRNASGWVKHLVFCSTALCSVHKTYDLCNMGFIREGLDLLRNSRCWKVCSRHLCWGQGRKAHGCKASAPVVRSERSVRPRKEVAAWRDLKPHLKRQQYLLSGFDSGVNCEVTTKREGGGVGGLAAKEWIDSYQNAYRKRNLQWQFTWDCCTSVFLQIPQVG